MRITGINRVVALSASLAKTAATTDAAAKRITVYHGAQLLRRVKANVAGRPGPRKVTGDYQRSWAMEVHDGAGTTTVEIGTNEAQGRRLELGFVGPDALGRVYDQPPYPHLGPAYTEVEPEFVRALSALGATIIGR